MSDHTPRLLDALDAFGEGIYIIDKNYTIEYMNKFMTNLFGQGVGKKCHEMLIKSDKPCEWCKYDEVFNKNETHHGQIYIESVDRTFSLSEIPVTNRTEQNQSSRSIVT